MKLILLSSELEMLIYSIGVFLVIIPLAFIVYRIIRGKDLHIQDWRFYIAGLSYSSQTFYTQLEEKLKLYEIDGIRTGRKDIALGNLMLDKRIYMTITWREYRYDICAAPLGSSFFFSYWLVHNPTGILQYVARIPRIGPWLVRVTKPVTYYTKDTDAIVHDIVHQCIVNTINEIGKEQELEVPPELNKRPAIQDLFKR